MVKEVQNSLLLKQLSERSSFYDDLHSTIHKMWDCADKLALSTSLTYRHVPALGRYWADAATSAQYRPSAGK